MADQTALVSGIKNQLLAEGVSLAGPCGAFEITRRVAWTLRNDGWGYISAPPGGENCNGFRTDKLVTRDGQFVDLLADAGGANTPVWQWRAATPDEVVLWREPAPVNGTPPPAPPPEPAQPPAPPPDVVAFAHELFTELEHIVDGLTNIATALDSIGVKLDTLNKSGVRIHL